MERSPDVVADAEPAPLNAGDVVPDATERPAARRRGRKRRSRTRRVRPANAAQRAEVMRAELAEDAPPPLQTHEGDADDTPADAGDDSEGSPFPADAPLPPPSVEDVTRDVTSVARGALLGFHLVRVRRNPRRRANVQRIGRHAERLGRGLGPRLLPLATPLGLAGFIADMVTPFLEDALEDAQAVDGAVRTMEAESTHP